MALQPYVVEADEIIFATLVGFDTSGVNPGWTARGEAILSVLRTLCAERRGLGGVGRRDRAYHDDLPEVVPCSCSASLSRVSLQRAASFQDAAQMGKWNITGYEVLLRASRPTRPLPNKMRLVGSGTIVIISCGLLRSGSYWFSGV